MREFLLLVELLECHAFRGNGGHHAGGHYVVGLHLVQFDDVLDNLVFTVIQHAFFLSHIGHGRYLLPRDAGVRIFVGDAVVQFFDNPHNGVEETHQELHYTRKPQKVFPMGGADTFGDYF